MLPFNSISTTSVALRGHVAASLVVYGTTAIAVTIGGVDTPTVEGAVLASVDDVVGSVLGPAPTRTLGRNNERYTKKGNG